MAGKPENHAREWGDDPRLAGARVEVYRQVGGVELLVYAFDPAGLAPGDRRPGMVFFHGGGWEGGDPAQFGEQSKYLARRGMVALSAEYRVKGRQGVGPWECVEDAVAAVKWARGSAARLGIDPGRLAAGGGSAGGHLAACAGVCPVGGGESRPNALVLFNPVLDTVGERWAERFGERAGDASPLLHVGPDAPPAIVFHGKDDDVVPCSQAVAFAAAMKKAGNRCELMLFDGAGHGFFNYARREEGFYRETVRAADRFLASLGWLEGGPEI